jgi:hypothetical protein
MYKILIGIVVVLILFIVFKNKDKIMKFLNKGNQKAVVVDTDFIPCETFMGLMDDYIFKKDIQGLGYYIDKKI